MTVSYPERDTPEWDIPLRLYIDDIVNRVRATLPGGGGINRLGSLGPLFAAIARRTTTPCRIVTLGSSTTAGENATTPENRWVNVFAKRAQATYPSGSGVEPATRSLTDAFNTPNTNPGIEVINGAVAGSYSHNYYLGAVATAMGPVNPDLVIHMIGSNDSVPGANYVSPSAYKVNISLALDHLDSAHASGTPVCHLLVHTYRRNGVMEAEWADYGQALQEISQARRNVAYLDLSESYEVAKHLSPDPYNIIDTDIIHLTNEGHAMMGYLIAAGLGFHGSPIPAPGGGGGGGSAATTTFTPSGTLAATNVQTALVELANEKLQRNEVFTSTLATTLRKIELNYTMSTTSANLSEVWLSGKLTSWVNEWGALRGTSPYSWGDALVRGIREDGDGIGGAMRSFVELVDRRSGGFSPEPKTTIWGISWATGHTIRNGQLMADVWVRPSPTAPIPPELPAGTVVVTLPTGP